MKRYFFESGDLQDLENIQAELEREGLTRPQIHVLSERDGELERHHLYEVESMLRKDVIHSGLLGALVGVVAAVLMLGFAYLLGWTESQAGWVPFIFLAIVLLGFCTWEGGFLGFQAPHHQFKHFQKALREGRHILLIDVDAEEEPMLSEVVRSHPKLMAAGTGNGAPKWLLRWRNGWDSFIKSMP